MAKTTKPATKRDFERLIAEARADMVKLSDREAALPERRRAVALGAQCGDAEDAAALREIEADETEIDRGLKNCRSAIAGAEQEIRSIERAEAEADMVKRHAEITRLNNEASELAPRFDETITELNLIAARIDEIRALQRAKTTIRASTSILGEHLSAIVLGVTGGRGMLSKFVPRPMSVRHRVASMRELCETQNGLVEGAMRAEREEFEAQAPVDHNAKAA